MLKPEHREAIYRLALQQQHADLSDYLDSITVPEGWQVVPVEPTEAILDVLYDNGIDEHDEYLRNVYRAMLASAPRPGGSNE